MLAPADRDARRLLAFVMRHRLRMVPRLLRPPIAAAARVLWCIKAVPMVRGAARKFGFGTREALRQYADACLFGLHPKDSYAWRLTVAERRPISTRAFWQIVSALSDPDQRARLDDKLATAAAVQRFPVAMPRLLAVIPPGTLDPVLPDADAMFVKPCRGRRSRNAFSIVRSAPGRYRINGAPCSRAAVAARLRDAAASDALLVQERVTGVPELADLGGADGAPLVIRIMTMREPDGEPFVSSAWVTIRVPGENPSHPLRDALRAPIAIASGSLLAGYWLGEPRARFAALPWNQAPIAGRIIPGFAQAGAAAVTAAQAFLGVPMIGWDVILTERGPVLLEGNSAVDWLVLAWMAEGAPDAPPLLQSFRRWADARPDSR